MRYVSLAKFSLLLLVSSNILYPAAPPARGWFSWMSRGRLASQQAPAPVAALVPAPAAAEQPGLGELFTRVITQPVVRETMLKRSTGLSDRDVQILARVNHGLRQSFQKEAEQRLQKISKEFEERAEYSEANIGVDSIFATAEEYSNRLLKFSELPTAHIDFDGKVDCKSILNRLPVLWSSLHQAIDKEMKLLVASQHVVRPDQRQLSPRYAPILVYAGGNNLGLLPSLKIFIDTIATYTMETFTSQSHYPDLDRPVINSLDLTQNAIRRIEPGVFTALPGLRELYLPFNALEMLEPEAFKGLRTLKRLNLQCNPIHLLLEGSFAGLGNLQELNLANTNLDILYPGEFAGLDNLRKLDLSGSKITEIQPGTFDGLRNIEEIDLGHLASLKSLDPMLFTGLTTLKTINLTGSKHLRDIVPTLCTLYPTIIINHDL